MAGGGLPRGSDRPTHLAKKEAFQQGLSPPLISLALEEEGYHVIREVIGCEGGVKTF